MPLTSSGAAHSACSRRGTATPRTERRGVWRAAGGLGDQRLGGAVLDVIGLPIAGVILSVALLGLAVAWWRTDIYGLLLGHYGRSLVGVLFDVSFLYLQKFVIKAVCIWCVTYEGSLLLRFLIAFAVWYRQPRPQS
ncbi:MAG TPA: vitamin K epoxide reductase family protein [Candidatus Limnocylindrales bacterium]|nr:vitamin K epoxide reductase family protein [Candidatus Limnocylindrales bacterium]